MIKSKYLTLINLIIVTYFVSLYLINVFKIDATIINIFRELLTFPLLVAQLLFLTLSVIHFVNHGIKGSLHILSTILLFTCSVLTIGSFFCLI